MALHTGSPNTSDTSRTSDANPFMGLANPALSAEVSPPRLRLAEDPVPADVAYQLVHDELLLDGSARLNLATFVTTWMEPQARALMAECVDKNMIDKDEYPQTAELERRCVAILADLWHAPDAGDATGCSTTGSSEACMLAGMALQAALGDAHAATIRPASPTWSWARTSRSAGRSSAATGMSSRAWCRWRATASTSTPATAAAAVRREHDRRRRRSSARPSTAATSRSPRSAAALDDAGRARRPGRPGPRRRRVRRDDRAVPRPGSGVGLPAAAGGVDQHLRPQVRAGLPRRRLGAVARHATHLPEELVFNVNYLGGNMPTFALNFSRPGRRGRRAVLHVLPARPRRLPRRAAGQPATSRRTLAAADRGDRPQFRLISRGDELPVFAFTTERRRSTGWDVFAVSRPLRERGWQVPAYTFPENREDLAVLRIVCRNGFSHDLADDFLQDLQRSVDDLQKADHRVISGPSAFHH